LPAAANGAIAAFADEATARAGPGESAFWFLSSSTDALEARAALFDAAVASLDIQYFIWQDDLTSYFLLQRILAAADRGVRVRLLVDDYSASGRDVEFFALAQHENVEVRSFNAFRARAKPMQVLEFIFRFGTLNHRMHNKSILADGRAGIIGGRNIGDRYFGIYTEFIQYDLDILFAGDLVAETQRGFDLFWNSSHSVVTHEYLRPRRRVGVSLEELRSFLAESVRGRFVNLAGFSIGSAQWLASSAADPMFGRARFISDSPDIDADTPERIKDEIYAYLASARDELVLISAYVIPDEELITMLEAAVRRGVRVVIVTNSVQSNNHMLAHVAYRKYRKRLLEAGIELFELRPDAAILAEQSVPPVEPGFVGLHSKAAVVDRRVALVGTANIDPRALDINTESAIFIEGDALANELRALILEATVPENAWRVTLDDRGRVMWTSDSEVRRNEPVRGPWHRIMQFLHTLLPLKGQA
jgi:putative cardiolipin synthase